jgi:hypothetical protein
MDIDKVGLIAQEISFAFEDHFNDVEKRNLFDALFVKYLSEVDPSGAMIPYDAIMLLARQNRDKYEQMLKEMREANLITG